MATLEQTQIAELEAAPDTVLDPEVTDWEPTPPPTDSEQAQIQAEQEHQRAERLAARLRLLGEDPDNL